MQFATILEIVSLIIPLVLATSKTIIKGNKKYIVAVVAYFILKKMAVEAAKQKALSEIQSGGSYLNAGALATLYKQAMNPSGYEFLMDNDGTDEELIFELANKTGNFKDVFNAYRTQYNRNLTTDLQNELSSDEYRRFLAILN